VHARTHACACEREAERAALPLFFSRLFFARGSAWWLLRTVQPWRRAACPRKRWGGGGGPRAGAPCADLPAVPSYQVAQVDPESLYTLLERIGKGSFGVVHKGCGARPSRGRVGA
jgi:hypothetical protein